MLFEAVFSHFGIILGLFLAQLGPILGYMFFSVRSIPVYEAALFSGSFVSHKALRIHGEISSTKTSAISSTIANSDELRFVSSRETEETSPSMACQKYVCRRGGVCIACSPQVQKGDNDNLRDQAIVKGYARTSETDEKSVRDILCDCVWPKFLFCFRTNSRSSFKGLYVRTFKGLEYCLSRTLIWP